ncbi:2587_t:CDS:2, partial [Acaulospora colombiana]
AAEGRTEIKLHKEPKLFKLIHAHLQGYDILPLSDACIPEYMTKETALQNLLKEALYYGLGELQDMIEALTQEQTVVEVEETRKPRRYRLAECDRLGHWQQDEISESGFQFICSRILAQPNLRLRLPQGLDQEGFKVVVGWTEGADGYDSSTFALLESV